MGKFEKGNTYSTGRKLGSKNRASAEIRDAFQLLVNNNLEKLQSDLDSLEANDRIKHVIALAAFVIPRKKASDVSISQNFDDVPLFNINLGDVEMK